MSLSEWIVLAGGVALIVFELWFFLGDRAGSKSQSSSATTVTRSPSE